MRTDNSPTSRSPDVTERPVALVTGSRRGIGRHISAHLVARGYTVVGCSPNAADWELEGYEHEVADVGSEKDVVALLRGIRKRHGGLSVLVNNAGAASMNHVLTTPGETVERIVRTNLIGTILVSRESAKLMMPGGWGRIVNLSTVAVPLRLEGEAIYASAKAGVEVFTRILARELAPLGITVNAIGPAPTPTDLTRGVPSEALEKLIGRLSIQRPGTFADVTNVLDFLLGRESDAVTGQVLYLGGAG
jgi:3-oxoacyl-[acyl-carrier protein] reductase